jgi:AcrR family transcriptional regulator
LTTTRNITDDIRPRRPGRPRSARVDRAVLDAVLPLLVETGLEGLTIDALAVRAGVGKAAIYRRWATKEAIVADAFRAINDQVTMPDTGSVRDDMLQLMREYLRVTLGVSGEPILPRIASAALSSPLLREIFWEHALMPRRRALASILHRGQARGEVRADLTLELVLDMFGGTIFLRILFGDPASFPTRELPGQLIDVLLRGIATGR